MKSFLQVQKPVLLCACLFILLRGLSQSVPLQVGDKVPDINFAKNFNPAFITNRIGDLSGNVVILDFFNSGCLACLKGVPVMDSLQQKFNGRVQIIMITNNNDTQVKKFFNRLPKLPSFPIIINDSNFYNYLFPHEGDPLHIWIDQDGIIKAITDHHNTTVSNIQKLLDQDTLKVFRRPVNAGFEINKTLLEIDKSILKNQADDYSLFFKPLNEYFDFNRLRIYRDSLTGVENGLTAVNIPLYSLYSLAYSKDLFSFPVNTRNLITNNKIEIKVGNILDLKDNTVDSLYDEWRARNLASYELKVNSNNNFYRQLQNDLERFTPFTATIKIENKQCLILMVTNKKVLRDKVKKTTNGYAYIDSSGLHISGTSLQNSLLPQLAIVYQADQYPIIDETNFFDPLTLKITANISDLNGLNRELLNYGLEVKKEFRRIKVLEIRDKSK